MGIYGLVAVKFLECYFFQAGNKGKDSLLVVVSESWEELSPSFKGLTWFKVQAYPGPSPFDKLKVN